MKFDFLCDFINKVKYKLGILHLVEYKGNYNSWDEARRMVKGYDSDEIFEKVKKTSLKVKKGEACFDRDTWLFFEEEYNYPLLFHMMNDSKELKVLDWGGATGSTYFQNAKLLKRIARKLEWIVIEQPHFANWGQNELADDCLHFLDNRINTLEIIKNKNINIVLLSSVLQYLDFSDSLIEEIVNSGVDKIILERTPVGKRDRIMVEKVKEPIYKASYVAHIYEEKNLLSKFKGYKLIASWKSMVDEDIVFKKDTIACFKSYVFEKIRIIN